MEVQPVLQPYSLRGLPIKDIQHFLQEIHGHDIRYVSSPPQPKTLEDPPPPFHHALLVILAGLIGYFVGINMFL